MFDANSKEFDDVGQFKNNVASSLGAIDVLVNSTSLDSSGDLKSGDILFDSQVSHIQVVDKNTTESITIYQGNLGLGWSADPTSIGYKGVDVQTGKYDKKTGDYKRDSNLTSPIKDYLDELFLLRWNFNQFNGSEEK